MHYGGIGRREEKGVKGRGERGGIDKHFLSTSVRDGQTIYYSIQTKRIVVYLPICIPLIGCQFLALDAFN